MLFVGIDPGLSGAACAFMCREEPSAVSNGGPAFISDVIDLPVIPDGSKNQLDIEALCDWLLRLPERPTRAFIENVAAMPSIPGPGGVRRSMGAASAFRFGMAAGQLRGALVALRTKVELTHPATWKAFYGLRGADKEASRLLAIKLHPEIEPLLRRKKDHQRAEAILIARHAAELRFLT